MRSHRAVRVAAAVWACLLRCLRSLAGGPGARGRGRSLCSRVVAAGVAALLVTAGLYAAPARAASAAPADSAVSAPVGSAASVPGLVKLARAVAAKEPATLAKGATTVTLPTTITASYDYPDYPVGEMTAVINNWLPEALGLPNGASLPQVISAIQASWQQDDPPEDWQNPEPNDLSGATDTVTSDGGTGSILTVTAPTPSGADTPRPGGTVNPVFAGFLAQLAAFVVSAGTTVVLGAYLFGLPTNDSVWAPAFGNARPGIKQLVAVAAGVLAGVTSALLYWSMTSGSIPSDSIPWRAIVGAALGTSVSQYANSWSLVT